MLEKLEENIHVVLENMEENAEMEFGEWEVNNDIWLKETGEGKVQESLLERRCRKAHGAVATAAKTPLT